MPKPWEKYGAPPAAPAAAPKPWEKYGTATAEEPQGSAAGRFLGGVWENVNPINIVKGVAGAVMNPVDTVKTIAGAQGEQFGKAGQAWDKGRISEAIGHGAAGVLPLIGPAAANAGERIGSGDVAGGLGEGVGMLIPIKIPGLVKGVASKAAAPLKSSAVRLYEQALYPTKQATKKAAERVVPEMLERGIQGSLKSIGETTAKGEAAAGKAVRKAYTEATAAGQKIDAEQLAANMDALKKPFRTVNAAGEEVVLNPKAVATIEEIQGTLTQLGKDATPSQVWQYRKIVDDLVSSTNGFSRELSRGSAAELRKSARNMFNDELKKAVPNIEKLNADYSFWTSAKKIVDETTLRKRGQQSTVEALRDIGRGTGPGAAIGLAVGGPMGAAFGGALGTAASKLIRTPMWRTWSATKRAALADILAGGAEALSTTEGRQVATLLSLLGARAGDLESAPEQSQEAR